MKRLLYFVLALLLAGCGVAGGLGTTPSNTDDHTVKSGNADGFVPSITNSCEEPKQSEHGPRVVITNTNNCNKDNPTTTTVGGEG